MDNLAHEVAPGSSVVDPKTSAVDIEMEDVSEKVPKSNSVETSEEVIPETKADDVLDSKADSPSIENKEVVADESMDVIEDELLEETKTTEEESSNKVIETEPPTVSVETEAPADVIVSEVTDEKIVDSNSAPESAKPDSETTEITVESSEKPDTSKTVVVLEDENDTLVLNSDVDSASSDHDIADHGEEDDYDEYNDDHMFDIINEGKAKIYIPAGKKGVFYNPVQEFNRDLSVAVLTVFAIDHQSDPTVKKYQKKMKWATSTSDTEEEEDEEDEDVDLPLAPGRKCKNGISVLDALSATGLRSMRYGLEVAGVNTVMANDMSEVAVKIIDKNVRLNNLNRLVVSRRFDAIHLMQLEKIRGRHFDAIDLDPFGNPTRFLDAAVSSLRDGGLLLVTCTDMAVLCGNTPETCYVKYNAVSLKTAACHEMALRICLHLIETVCSKYGRFIVPLLSFHADFYIRVFVKVFTSPQTCKATSTKTSMVFKCIGCNTLSFQPLGMVYQVSGQTKFNLSHGPVVNAKCAHCEGRHVMAGPIWTGPLHDAVFVQQVLDTSESLGLTNTRRITGMLAVILEELKDIPLYYTLTNLCSVLHCEVIPMQDFRSALLHAKYKVSLSHCAKNSFKTNAPMSVVWDILRCWVKLHPIAEKRLEDTTVRNLLSKPPAFEANFAYHPESISDSAGLLRYQQNPAPYWGPGRKSTTNIGDARPKSNNTHPAPRDSPTDQVPPSKRFKKSGEGADKSIELITLTDEEDGDSLDREIFNLSKIADDAVDSSKGGSVASLSAIQAKANQNKSKNQDGNNKVIEEYNLCDDDDDDDMGDVYDGDDDLRIVNGDVGKKKTREDEKSLDDLEKELNQEIEKFDRKTKSALEEADLLTGESEEGKKDRSSSKTTKDIVYDLEENETVSKDNDSSNSNLTSSKHIKENDKTLSGKQMEEDDILELDAGDSSEVPVAVQNANDKSEDTSSSVVKPSRNSTDDSVKRTEDEVPTINSNDDSVVLNDDELREEKEILEENKNGPPSDIIENGGDNVNKDDLDDKDNLDKEIELALETSDSKGGDKEVDPDEKLTEDDEQLVKEIDLGRSKESEQVDGLNSNGDDSEKPSEGKRIESKVNEDNLDKELDEIINEEADVTSKE
uniref:tRNA (guanine(26)-N(2))-dimethyltransferase n=1 Tax=Cacopsylla melanoneura TaxID=428564 RepID=A0A8D9F0Z2_9HEMI